MVATAQDALGKMVSHRLKGRFRRDEKGFLLTATTHDLKKEIGARNPNQNPER